MLVPAVLAAALVVGALFAGESFWLGALALLAAGVAATLALLGRLPLARGGGSVVGALLAIAIWNGISVAWSIAPDRSWGELNRGLVYASFAVVGVVLGSLYGDRSARVVAAILTGAFAVAILWALAGKAIPALFPDGGRAARLRDPIGYWNALALVGDGLLVLGLWLAATRSAAVALRAGGAVLAYAAAVAILLTGSRAGVGAGIIGVGLWLWLGRSRTERALLALATTVPALAVGGWAFTRPALVDDGQEYADRLADGVVFALALPGRCGHRRRGGAATGASRAEPGRPHANRPRPRRRRDHGGGRRASCSSRWRATRSSGVARSRRGRSGWSTRA